MKEAPFSSREYRPGIGSQHNDGDDPQPAGRPDPDWPAPLGLDATPGIVGEFVAILMPRTEADTAALVFQFLTAVGNAIGNKPYYLVESDEHTGRLNTLLIGLTAKARKGTSWGRVRAFVGSIDLSWATTCIVSGLSSGDR